jgi:hypothetical protein
MDEVMKRIWICREKSLDKLGSNEVWELQLHSRRNTPTTVGFVQLFPNNSTAYWFKLGEVGKPGPAILASDCHCGSCARNAAMVVVEKAVADMKPRVAIPDNPAERSYSCPGCNKPVVAKRVGESCTYIVEHIQKNICTYKGPVQ